MFNSYHGNDSKISWVASLSSFSSFSLTGNIDVDVSLCLEPVMSCACAVDHVVRNTWPYPAVHVHWFFSASDHKLKAGRPGNEAKAGWNLGNEAWMH